MKRYIALILVLLLISAVAACKKTPQSSENSGFKSSVWNLTNLSHPTLK